MFGKVTAANGAGVGAWAEHDGSKTWSDGKQVEKQLARVAVTLASTGDELRAIVGNHVRDAVAEYAQSAEYGLSVHQGQLCIAARYWNVEADFTVLIPLRQLMAGAIKEAYGRAADPAAMELMTAVAVLAKDLSITANATGKKAKTA